MSPILLRGSCFAAAIIVVVFVAVYILFKHTVMFVLSPCAVIQHVLLVFLVVVLLGVLVMMMTSPVTVVVVVVVVIFLFVVVSFIALCFLGLLELGLHDQPVGAVVLTPLQERLVLGGDFCERLKIMQFE